ncbi:extracellular solute-binding protein [Thermobifida halotolerans]|uniref:Extracellular solute-binding protein n=1 Tax=Thermobifida halotolerans TaxID=483545 RepID=A0AA97LYH6_9ACTN|nr:extracellular solute-binding protein [Thermobifida halotolerans]UOE20572.1 extracellular solute-binding protein [Thermobifida halotolerans]
MRNRPEGSVRARTVPVVLGVLLLTACASPPPRTDGSGRDAVATAASAAELGGMDELIRAAQAEGELNVVALPPERTDHGEMVAAFERKYGIKVNPAAPDASDEEQLDVAARRAGTDRAPDVFDLRLASAADAAARLAEYRVETWDDVPEDSRHPGGRYVGDHTVRMSVGFDADEVPAPEGVEDLLATARRGAVALDGDPRRDESAFFGVVMAALGSGGDADDVAPGVRLLAGPARTGRLRTAAPSPDAIASGEVPVVVDWEHANLRRAAELAGRADWRVVVPEGAAVGFTSCQAINRDAPHPAAARLWQEFVLSDEGQNIRLGGLVRPVRLEAMAAQGSVDTRALAALPAAEEPLVTLTAEQTGRAERHLAEHWIDPPAR